MHESEGGAKRNWTQINGLSKGKKINERGRTDEEFHDHATIEIIKGLYERMSCGVYRRHKYVMRDKNTG